MHTPLWQSVPALHALPAAHLPHVAPPQPDEHRADAEEQYEASRIVPLYESFYNETLGLPPKMPAHLAPPGEGMA